MARRQKARVTLRKQCAFLPIDCRQIGAIKNEHADLFGLGGATENGIPFRIPLLALWRYWSITFYGAA
jgi:hypothetical protein